MRLMSGNADSKQTSGPTRRPSAPGTRIVTGPVPRSRSSPAARPIEVAQPMADRAGMYSPNGTSRILSYRSPVSPSGPTSTALLKMPVRPAPSVCRASTLTRTSAPTVRDSAASRAAISGRRTGSTPTLLSPHTTRSTSRPASDRVSSSLRANLR